MILLMILIKTNSVEYNWTLLGWLRWSHSDDFRFGLCTWPNIAFAEQSVEPPDIVHDHIIQLSSICLNLSRLACDKLNEFKR